MKFAEITVIIALGNVVSGQSDFEVAMNEMIDYYSLDIVTSNYSTDYYNYAVTFDKLTDYQLNGTDNYTELYDHYLAYTASVDAIIQLNNDYNGANHTVSVYKTDSAGNYTQSVNYTFQLESPYGFTSFSDLTESESASYMLQDDDDGSSSTYPDCEQQTELGTYWYDFQFSSTYTGAVEQQGAFGTCWAFASFNQFRVNNQWATKSSTWSQCGPVCYTTLCTKSSTGNSGYSCGNQNGGDPVCATQWFAIKSACVQYGDVSGTCTASDMYSNCLTNSLCDSDCAGSYAATKCMQMATGYLWWNFLAASRLVSGGGYSFSFSTQVGSNFQTYRGGNGPITADILCGNPVGYHAMTVVGVSTRWDPNMGTWIVKNSWGSGWGNGGYFYMSVQAYVTCAVNRQNRLSWNTFGDGDVRDTESEDGSGNVSGGSRVYCNLMLYVMFCIIILFI